MCELNSVLHKVDQDLLKSVPIKAEVIHIFIFHQVFVYVHNFKCYMLFSGLHAIALNDLLTRFKEIFIAAYLVTRSEPTLLDMVKVNQFFNKVL